ncbi:MAG: hypothetical protein ACXVCM_02375 [Ktedonobacteraceae bacterium]
MQKGKSRLWVNWQQVALANAEKDAKRQWHQQDYEKRGVVKCGLALAFLDSKYTSITINFLCRECILKSE